MTTIRHVSADLERLCNSSRNPWLASSVRMSDQRPPAPDLPWAPRHGRDLIAEAEAKRAEVAALLNARSRASLIIECRIGDAGYIIRITDTNTFRQVDYPIAIPPQEIASGFLLATESPN